MTKDPGAYLACIYDCIGRIRGYMEAGKDACFSDPKTQDAVIRVALQWLLAFFGACDGDAAAETGHITPLTFAGNDTQP